MSGGGGDQSDSERASNRDRPTNREKYLGRRRFLMAAGALAGVGIAAGNAAQGDAVASQETPTPGPRGPPTQETVPIRVLEEVGFEERYPGLEVLVEEPANAQAEERETYTDFVTPEEEHFIRNHYPTPEIDESEWTVSLTGLADRDDVELSVEDVKREFETETVIHAMQCSGNGRAYFEPQVGGNPWTYGALGNAVWTGTPLSAILEAFDADTSEGRYLSVMGGDAPEGQSVFTRSIPMQKVMDDCILAYEMNGDPMFPEHGYPLRLVVPGWFGNNNVKWVERMHVMDMMVFGEEWEQYVQWQQQSYRIVPQDEEATPNRTIPIFDTQEQMESDEIDHAYLYDQMVKSLIGYPPLDSTVATGMDGQVEVLGVAWAGDDEVSAIEVSTDGGESFEEAEFFGPSPGPESWRQWRYKWDASPGEYTLVSRATDSEGRTQPATISRPEAGLDEIRNDMYPWNQGGYGATAYEPMAVTVEVVEEAGEATPTGAVLGRR